MENIQDLFFLIYQNRFLKTMCGLEPKSGINHRLNGISTNTRAKLKPLTKEDKEAIKNGWKTFVDEGSKVIDEL